MAYSGIAPRGFTPTTPLSAATGANGLVAGFKARTNFSVALPQVPFVGTSILCVFIHVKAAALPSITISSPGFTFTARTTYTGASFCGVTYIGTPTGAATSATITITSPTASTVAVGAVEMVGTDLNEPVALSAGTGNYRMVDGQYVASNTIQVASNSMLRKPGGYTIAEVPTNGATMHFFADVGVNACNVSSFGSGQYGNYGHPFGTAGATAGGSASTNLSYSQIMYGDEEDARTGSANPSRVTCVADYAGTNVYPIEGAGLSVTFQPPVPSLIAGGQDTTTGVDTATVQVFAGQSGVRDVFSRLPEDQTITEVWLNQRLPVPYGPEWQGFDYINNSSGAHSRKRFATQGGVVFADPIEATNPQGTACAQILQVGIGDQVVRVDVISLPQAGWGTGLAVGSGYGRPAANGTGGTSDPWYAGAFWDSSGVVKACYGVVTKTDVALAGGVSRAVLPGDRVQVTWTASSKTVTVDNVTTGQTYGSVSLAGSFNPTTEMDCCGLIDSQPSGVASVGGGNLDNFRAYLAAAGSTGLGNDTGGAVTESATVDIVGAPMQVELWESGVFRATLLANFAVPTGSAGQVVDLTWDAGLLSDPSGAGVEIRVVSPADSKVNNILNVESINWDAQYLVPSQVDRAGADTATSVETATLVARITAAGDVGVGTDLIQTFFDDGNNAAKNSSDFSTTIEGERVRVSSDSDVGSSTAAASLTARVSSSETTTSVDGARLSAQLSSSDSGVGFDALKKLDRDAGSSDSGYGMDSESVLKPPKEMVLGKQFSLVGRASFDLQ